MKRAKTTAAAAAMAASIVAVMVMPPPEILIWNRSESAPTGLYLKDDLSLERGRWVLVSSEAKTAKWIASRGYLAPGWPLIKQIRGLPGEQICRSDQLITINNSLVAQAKTSDNRGRKMPVWSGCITLRSDQVFLINEHPSSLDGRYFGATSMRDLSGGATPLFQRE